MTPARTSERGQVLVMVAASLIVLMAIGALVVDIGFSWMLHRQEQNAADPGAIAAARWLKDSGGLPRSPFPEAYTDACFYAQQNGFFASDATDCAAARAAGDLQVAWPPTSGPYMGRSDAIQVVITATHPSFFGRIFGAQTAVVTTSAVAINSAGNSNSSSLVALQTQCGVGAGGPSGGAAGKVSGGGTVKIFPASGVTTSGGYVHVNVNCGSSNDDVCANGTGTSALAISGTLITPYAYVGGSCTYNGTGANGLQCSTGAASCLDEGALPLADPLAGLPEPQLSNFPNGVCPNGSQSTPASTKACDLPPNGSAGDTYCPKDASGVNVCHLTPGVYYGGFNVGTKVRLELDPGMYILAGGGIHLSGSSSIEAIQGPTGVEARITIFSTDGPGCPTIGVQCQGDITFTANQAFQAKATNGTTCAAVSPSICPWKGILLWQDGTASNSAATVTLGGQASTIMAGTIYAPLAEVDINGGTYTSGCSGGASASCLSIQIIAYRWKIDGGGLVEMPYDPSELYQLNQRGLVR